MPINGFDTCLTAALQKKNVQVAVVADKDKAEYILTGSSLHEDKNWAARSSWAIAIRPKPQ
jgi:fructose-specific component phosphotransferase system IIB-like protein